MCCISLHDAILEHLGCSSRVEISSIHFEACSSTYVLNEVVVGAWNVLADLLLECVGELLLPPPTIKRGI